ncbi:gp297 [Sphingomonas phage PAU]|uniref:gp297 n=1 Tax=Sphingomonas phage PAU TaxID=1150991 RepID=UPI00025734A8|nr:gp297 [Sphingomonas phage PAU]AFF28294.1 gp297 [Sphingomonas phage PAU]
MLLDNKKVLAPVISLILFELLKEKHSEEIDKIFQISINKINHLQFIPSVDSRVTVQFDYTIAYKENWPENKRKLNGLEYVQILDLLAYIVGS